jgi:hypothetical protein
MADDQKESSAQDDGKTTSYHPADAPTLSSDASFPAGPPLATKVRYTDLSQMTRLRGAATTPMGEVSPPQVRLQGFSPKKAAATRPVSA